jgi:hypothetical protein
MIRAMKISRITIKKNSTNHKHSGGATIRFAAVFMAVGALLTVLNLPVLAQTVDDALRHTQRNSLYTARTAALGDSYLGIADDFAALYSNPAGLTLLPWAEFTAGVQGLSVNNSSSFVGNSIAWSTSGLALGHIGLALPIRTPDFAMSFAFGYAQENNFLDADTVAGFNPNSSIAQSWLPSGADLQNNRAWNLKLADTVNGRFIVPLNGNVTQSAFTQQTGSMQSFSAGFGIDIASGIAVGASLIGSFGSYTYTRDYYEVDNLNRHSVFDMQRFTTVDFFRLAVREDVTQQIAGLRGLIGVQARLGERIRLGASVTTPGAYQIQEQASWRGDSFFDDNPSRAYPFRQNYEAEYTVTTPWVLSGGISGHIEHFTVSGSIEYVNLRDIKFAAQPNFLSPIQVSALNADVVRVLVGQTRWSVGVEYENPEFPLVGRASITSIASPFQQASVLSSSFIVGIGVGYYTGENTRLDALYRFSQRSYQTGMDGITTYRGVQTAGQFAVQLVYRF